MRVPVGLLCASFFSSTASVHLQSRTGCRTCYNLSAIGSHKQVILKDIEHHGRSQRGSRPILRQRPVHMGVSVHALSTTSLCVHMATTRAVLMQAMFDVVLWSAAGPLLEPPKDTQGGLTCTGVGLHHAPAHATGYLQVSGIPAPLNSNSFWFALCARGMQRCLTRKRTFTTGACTSAYT